MKLEKNTSNLSVAASVRPLVSTLVILITRPIKVVAKQLDDVLVSGAILPSSHHCVRHRLEPGERNIRREAFEENSANKS